MISLFKTSTGSQVASYSGHSAAIHGLALRTTGNFLSGGADRALLLWDAANQSVQRRWGSHGGTVTSVAWAADESLALSACYDRLVRLWDGRSPGNKPVQSLPAAYDSVSEVHSRGPLIAAASIDGHVRQYDVRMGRMLTDALGEPVVSIVYTIDQQAYLSTSLDSTVRLMDASTGALLNQ